MEKKVTLSFNAAELLEIAKMIGLARIFVHEDYENDQLAENIFGRLCATGYAEFNENGTYEHGAVGETPFTIADKVDGDFVERCVEENEDRLMKRVLSSYLASRDLNEKHPALDPENPDFTPAMWEEYKTMLHAYEGELTMNGVEHLRLVK